MTDKLIEVNQALQEQILRSKHAEDRFRALLEASPDAIIIVNSQAEIVLVNAQTMRIFGYSRDELLGKSIEILIPKSSCLSSVSEPQSGHTRTELELYARRNDDSQFPVEVSLSPIETKEGILIAYAIRDITERKQMVDALQTSEEQFRTTFEYAAIGIALVGLDGRWLQVNQAVCEIVGYSAAELVTKTFQDITHPDDLDIDLNYVRQLVAGEIVSYHMEKRYFHKQGHVVWVLLSVSLVRDTEGQALHFVSQIQNITERKQTEQALKAKVEEEHEFQTYLKALHEITIELTKIDDLDAFFKRAVEFGLQRLGFDRFGFLLFDPVQFVVRGTYGTDAQGKLVAEQHLRLDPAHLTGILLRAYQSEDRFVVDEETQLFSNFQAIGMGWNAAAIVWNGVEKLGWLAIDNGATHRPMTKAVLDILGLYALTLGSLLTQKRTQIALFEQRNLLRTLIDNLPDYIYIKDMTSHFVVVNQAMMNSATTSELIGKSDFDFHPPERAQAFFADEQALLQSGQALINKEEWVIDPQGNKRFILSTKIPLRDIQGHIIGLLGAGRDITDRKNAEAQALELGKEREQVKMLSNFIHDISHDFRTPLATISSCLYLLMKITDPEKQKGYFESAEGQIGRLTQLIDRLLIILQLDNQTALVLQPLDLNQMMLEVSAKVSFDARKKGITVLNSLWESNLMVQANPYELNLALAELGKNAMLYTPANGTITIRTRRENNHAIIEVSDTGVGISSADLPQIFHRLYRVDNARSTMTGGAGLGLSIAKRIIELHQGMIEVESVVGEGSTFRVILPLSP